MKGTPMGAWLRREREARIWTRADLARLLRKAAESRGDAGLPPLENLVHNIFRWELDQVQPSERYRLLLCEVLGIPTEGFGISQGEIVTVTGARSVVISITTGKDGAEIRVSCSRGRARLLPCSGRSRPWSMASGPQG